MKNKSTTLFSDRNSFVDTDVDFLRSYIDRKRFYLSFKRVFDLVMSAFFLLLVGTWLFPILALLIRMDSRGPIFFVQKRVGMGGRTFNCLKFRTMVVNSEAHNKQAEDNDVRITRLGRFLRISSLDELPQFLNVLLGHMSIVGPRPHMHSDCEKFSNIVPAYKFRNFLKPGITGLAQVKGFRGPTRDFESIFHRYQFDAFYIRNCNIWLDMRIIRMTFAQTIRILFYKSAVNQTQEDQKLLPDSFSVKSIKAAS